MDIFLSWSGERSKAAAQAFREWLPDIIQRVDAWVSADDISPGMRWTPQIASRLSVCQFGLVFLTKSNLKSEWIAFEAGALAKSIEDPRSRLVPILVDSDLEPTDITGPLSQFQIIKLDKTSVLKLVTEINNILFQDGLAVPDDRLQRLFERNWQFLETMLSELPKDKSEKASKQKPRETDDMLRELLTLARGKIRSQAQIEPIEIVGGTEIPDYERKFRAPFREVKFVGEALRMLVPDISKKDLTEVINSYVESLTKESLERGMVVQIPSRKNAYVFRMVSEDIVEISVAKSSRYP